MEFELVKEANASQPSPPLLNLFTDYDIKVKLEWMDKNWTVCFYVVAGYLAVIYGGQKYMKNRKPLDLTNALILWNFALAVFSLGGSYVFIREFLNTPTLHEFACGPWKSRSVEAVHWGWLFNASKFVELIDTLFLVLRKKPIIFLHWYHHVSVLLYCWSTYLEQNSTATIFAFMNFVVHSFMYSYYGLKAMRVKVPSKVAMTITSLQLLQMLGGLILIGYVLAAKVQEVDCSTTENSLYLALGMYASYFALFGNFFYKAYFSGGSKRRVAKKAQ